VRQHSFRSSRLTFNYFLLPPFPSHSPFVVLECIHDKHFRALHLLFPEFVSAMANSQYPDLRVNSQRALLFLQLAIAQVSPPR